MYDVDWFRRGKDKLAEAESELSQGRYQNAFQSGREAAEILLKSLLIAQGVSESHFRGGQGHDHMSLCKLIDWTKLRRVNRKIIETGASELSNFRMASGRLCMTEQTSNSRYPEGNIALSDAERTVRIAHGILSEVQKDPSLDN